MLLISFISLEPSDMTPLALQYSDCHMQVQLSCPGITGNKTIESHHITIIKGSILKHERNLLDLLL